MLHLGEAEENDEQCEDHVADNHPFEEHRTLVGMLFYFKPFLELHYSQLFS